MSDTNEKNVSSLAITEKKPHRPGGCVGIFFQLFDWNRRFAKKKLFSKKLLPPGRSKQGSKKFCGDEKLPKLRLIADENSGGFPNVKNDEQKHVMRPPTLVAKLMGLESMPAERPNKLKNASPSRINGVDDREKLVSNHHLGFHKDDWSMEKRDTRQNVRPQKLQKTGFSERSVNKFGTESLQLKNVLSRPKKHYSKLASPVKSPKSLSAGNASRLIGAATRILEPGLQAKNRAKFGITYAKSTRHVPVDEAMLSKCPNYYVNEAESCRNCAQYTRPNVEEQPSVFRSYVSDYVGPSQDLGRTMGPSQDSDRSKPKSPMSSFDQEQEKVFHKGQDSAEPISDREPIDQEGQIHQHVMGPQCKSQRDSPCSIRRVPPKSNAVNETKDFVALNRTLSGRTRSRAPLKSDNFKFETYGKVGSNRGDEILSPVRKRRSMNVGTQNDHFDLDKQKEIGRNGPSQESQVTGGSDKDKVVTSYAYTSPVKRRVQSNSSSNKTLQKNKSMNEIDGNACFRKPFPFRGDPLGAILEQKLKELNFQEEEKFGFGGAPPKRTSAMILQELISALNAERPYYQDTVTVRSNDRISNMNTNITFQAKPKKTPQDNTNLSPGCVLEASFSNDSCVSSSLDDSSGQKLCSDLLDSATSLSNGKTGKDFVTHLIDQISKALCLLDFANTKSNTMKLAHAKEVILNTELVFRALHSSDRTHNFSIVCFLLDELETLGSVMWTNFSSFLGFEDTKEGNLFKGFLLDCLVEYLESKYGSYDSYVWTGLPLNSEMLISKLVSEVRKWAGLAGLVRDEIVEREMSFGLGKWTDFEIEEFENGVEIGGQIFEGLVDEIVTELWECKVGFS